jgi:hypothetical protein
MSNGNVSRRCCGLRAPAALGAICPMSSGAGIAPTSALPAGLRRGVASDFRETVQAGPVHGSAHRLHHRSRPSAWRGGSHKVGPQALGRSRGGLSTKIHTLTDAAGLRSRDPVPATSSSGQGSARVPSGNTRTTNSMSLPTKFDALLCRDAAGVDAYWLIQALLRRASSKGVRVDDHDWGLLEDH